MVEVHCHLSSSIAGEKTECSVDMMAQDLPCGYNAVHRTIMPHTVLTRQFLSWSAALDAPEVVPCCAGVPQAVDTMEEHPSNCHLTASPEEAEPRRMDRQVLLGWSSFVQEQFPRFQISP